MADAPRQASAATQAAAAADGRARPALLLLHGAVLNGRMWEPVAAQLASDFQVLAPDLPGHGWRSREQFSLEAAAAVVQDSASKSASVTLVGDSMGSYVALAAAAALGKKLRGAVLAGVTANLQGLAALPLAARAAITGLFPPAKLQARLAQRIARDYAAGPAIVQGGIRPAAFAEALVELRKFDARAHLARLSVPVLLVNGSRDWLHRAGERGALAVARHARLQVIPGSGHGVSINQPAQFARLIREFAGAL